jgi:dGTPase
MFRWDTLLSAKRRKDSSKSTSGDTTSSRLEIERDFDRILFSAPTRRLADKTQVFPMEKNDSVRNRLTHSHEVSNLARSIGVRLAFEHTEAVFGTNIDSLEIQRNVPSLLASIGLVHDMGNPPFGHQGEESIKTWFRKKSESSEFTLDRDFLEFDGNAQTLRLVTKLQIISDDFGLNLTCGTLAALIKYPTFYNSKIENGYSKFGIFRSERSMAEQVWKATGLKEGFRHPLTYIMEACDDIAYSVIDAEDTVKKGYASYHDLMSHLQESNDPTIAKVITKTKAKHESLKAMKLRPAETNDLSMQMFRVYAIAEMINDTTQTFIDNIDSIMSGKVSMNFNIIDHSKSEPLCKHLKKFDFKYGYTHKDVLKLELEGSNYIHSLMDMIWRAINNKDDKTDHFAQYAYGRISENYKRIYQIEDPALDPTYKKCQLLCDYISGMTETHLIDIHNELKPLHDGHRSKFKS